MKQHGVYILHYEKKIFHAGHYTGMASDIPSRIKRHISGASLAVLPSEFRKKGILPRLGRAWGTHTLKEAYELEKVIKGRKNAPKMCMICTGKVE